MEFLSDLLSFFLHLDRHLAELANHYGGWLYGILFLIIFCETGLVVTPFLPGDSLLFAAGALAAVGQMNIHVLFLLLAVCRHRRRYGQLFGRPLPRRKGIQPRRPRAEAGVPGSHPPVFRAARRQNHHHHPLRADRAHLRAVRGRRRRHELWPVPAYNVAGGVAWTASFLYGGYFFGNLPFVKQNFTLVILAIIILSLMPGVVEYWRHRRAATGAG